MVLEEPRPPLLEVGKSCFSTRGRSPWTGSQPVTRPLPTQDTTTQKDKDKRPCLEWDLNPRSQYPSSQTHSLDYATTTISNLNIKAEFKLEAMILGNMRTEYFKES
jgi:hypothetical protein